MRWLSSRWVTASRILLHELAHAMTSTAEGGTDGHGAWVMGLYLQLPERYLRLPAASVLPSLQEARIEADLAARALFLDAALSDYALHLRSTERQPGLLSVFLNGDNAYTTGSAAWKGRVFLPQHGSSLMRIMAEASGRGPSPDPQS